MAVTVEQFSQRVGASYDHSVPLQAALDVAIVLVDDFIDTAVVPGEVKDECYLRVAEQIFNQTQVAQQVNNGYYETDQSPMPTSRNPMQGAYQLLRSYVLPW